MNGEDLGPPDRQARRRRSTRSSTSPGGPPSTASEERKQVVVDAAGYRERREAALRRAADRAVADALSFGRAGRARADAGARAEGRPHTTCSERTDVETHSEGDEPERRLVVTPAAAGAPEPGVSRETLSALAARYGLPLRRGGALRAAARGARGRAGSADHVRDPREAVDAHVADSLAGPGGGGAGQGRRDRRRRLRRRVSRACALAVALPGRARRPDRGDSPRSAR